MRYYDKDNRQLIYIKEAATPDFWDRRWEDEKLKQSVLAGARDHFVYPTTKRYLKRGAKVLEGGCGKGQFVYSLQSKGYDAYGVDFAEKTITKIRSLFPNLKLSFDDVRSLHFPDATFDGYWSIGVIEHFPEGYDAIMKEMYRVLKPGGYLFLTFPFMSPLRKLKARFGSYPTFDKKNFDKEHFYQFALNSKDVTKRFESFGFELIKEKPYSGLKGFKDESGRFRRFFQIIYDNKTLPGKILSYGLSILLAPFAGHTIILILKKKL